MPQPSPPPEGAPPGGSTLGNTDPLPPRVLTPPPHDGSAPPRPNDAPPSPPRPDDVPPSPPRPDAPPSPPRLPTPPPHGGASPPRPDDAPPSPPHVPTPPPHGGSSPPRPDNMPPPLPRVPTPPPHSGSSPPRPDGTPPSPPRVPTPPPHSDTSDDPPLVPAIVTATKEKRGRHRKGEPKAKPGKQSWVHGTKKVFFERRKEEWLRESEANRAGAFYTKVVKLYIKKYGRHLADHEDLAFDVEDPPDSVTNEVTHEVMDPEEQAALTEYQKALRGRIGQWYRSTYGSILKNEKTEFKNLFTGVLDSAPPRPQRGRIEHFYSRKFYEQRIKPTLDAELAALKKRAERTGEEPPESIEVVARVTAQVWEGESPGFKQECEMSMEREYQSLLKGWEASLSDSPTKTPEEIAATLANAAYYLQPFVDAIQQRFGMCASVLLCGPIGIRGGRIGMQSVHAGATKGLAPVNWPNHDWQAFSEVEKSMISLAKDCFSDAECRARALSTAPLTNGNAVASGSGGAQPPALSASGWGGSGSGAGVGAAAGGAAPVPPPASAPATAGIQGGTTSPPVQPHSQMGNPLSEGDGDKEDGGGGGGEGDNGDGDSADKGEEEGRGGDRDGDGTPQPYDEYWQRTDRADWTDELRRAHAAFESGRGWGADWGKCVGKFFDFESQWGFTEGTAGTANKYRPRQVAGWLSRMRKWHLPPSLGEKLGTQQEDGWVAEWWGWWKSMQPEQRVLDSNELSRPEEADWGKVASLHGNNGLLLVMATLCWWGERVHGRRTGGKIDEPSRMEWAAAVRDVSWVLEQILESGEIGRDDNEEEEGEEDDTVGKKRKRGRAGGATGGNKKALPTATEKMPAPRGRKRARTEELEAAEEAQGLRRGKRRQVDQGDVPRQTRSKAQAKTNAKGNPGERPKPKPTYGRKKA
ncbi:hypothetical protein B0H19DRAFT_1274998 [Mycena capillaripes]|nr:hypothetical protein B0H19DRAFT_1274998 [Mycena capillaripes]